MNKSRVSKPMGLTVILVLATVATCLTIKSDVLADYGAIFSATSGFIAAIWFYDSLQQQHKSILLQTQQIEEQRHQFQLEFQALRQEARRNARVLAREILFDMEKDLNLSTKDGKGIEDFPRLFVEEVFPLLKDITESRNPTVVKHTCEQFNAKFLPIKTFLLYLQEVGAILLEGEGKSVVTYPEEPEWFIDLHHKELRKEVIFRKYYGIAHTLSSFFLIRIKMDVVSIAYLTASALIVSDHFFKREVIIKDILELKEDGCSLAIGEEYLKTVSKEEIDKAYQELKLSKEEVL